MLKAIGLVSTGVAAIITLFVITALLTSQAASPESLLWPLPGLIFIDWGLLGLAPFSAVYVALLHAKPTLLAVPWIAFGGLIPLALLGAWSIGPLIALSAVFVLGPATLYAIQNKRAFLPVAGLVLAGAVGNLTLLFLFMALGGAFA